ncbi:MAG TPA: hypothetical protein VNL74_02340 [Methylococcus sp.]|nr:hypothetical protein [Methylococcus sp.]
MKTRRLAYLLSILVLTYQPLATGQGDPPTMASATKFQGPMSAIEVLNELLIMRPVGLIATIAGTAVFIATSPLSGLASIAPPHDAFLKASDALVVGPAAWTFSRPFGVYGYNPRGLYPGRREN